MPIISNINQRMIPTLTCPPGKQRIEYCLAELPGLLLEIRRTSATGTWYLRHKVNGKTKYKRIGNTETHTLAQAKQAAIQLKHEIQSNRSSVSPSSEMVIVPTLREFAESRYMPFAKAKKRSWKDDLQRLNQYILPKFGDRRMDEITRGEFVEFHLSLKAKGLAGATSDHFLKLCRRIYGLAVEWEVLAKNPLDRIKLFNEPNQVENLLNQAELERLMTVLLTHPNKDVCRILRFLLTTGSRAGEALTARWEDIDINSRNWQISAAQSKSKRVNSKPLNNSAIQVLMEIQPDERSRKGFIFVNKRTGDRYKCIHKTWTAIRKATGLDHLRIHDLRHQYASMLVNSGRSLYEVQQILGHSSPQVTQRYAHLSTATLQDAANAASAQLEAATPKLLPALPPEPKTGT